MENSIQETQALEAARNSLRPGIYTVIHKDSLTVALNGTPPQPGFV